ncbi:cobalt-precorrin-7 (C(5))-methyltransferase [Halobiforma nitratireducens]|uniref:Cobalt-precorrin-6Y C(5)-methyltransferase n=1 Tax=Halobiforma nitratireducens JCM 10879 TaxID=1227454 RepID=M0MD76_9EURY|nr:cobalt-precorrin-7 (C(5))-methyltransferase [Halobiforma nitratireducens]EMA42599.1 cobalt-precorrin-6Y C(5)-methyltransferase [Halobiforma nitratireducens JCM 10879]
MSDYDLDAGPDPATFAAAKPEAALESTRAEERDPVHVVGIGPGNREYLTPRGERAIREADVLVGFETVVDYVADVTTADCEHLSCGYRDEADALETFGRRVAAGETGVAVAMGDPNHSGYQFVGKVQDAVASAAPGTPVRVVPGISSLQVAASRARTPMESTEFVTLHKSGDLEAEMERLARAVVDDGRHLLALPRPFDRMPGDLAEFLLDRGASGDLEALVLERLTHDAETIHRFTLAELSRYAGGDGQDETPFSDLIVFAVRQPTDGETPS